MVMWQIQTQRWLTNMSLFKDNLLTIYNIMITQQTRRTDVENLNGAVELNLLTLNTSGSWYKLRTSNDQPIDAIVMETYTGTDGSTPMMTLMVSNAFFEKHTSSFVIWWPWARHIVVDTPSTVKAVTTLSSSDVVVGRIVWTSLANQWADTRQITCFDTMNGWVQTTVGGGSASNTPSIYSRNWMFG